MVESFSEGADFSIHWVSILVGRIVECEIYFSFFGRGPLDWRGLIWLASLA